MLETSEKNKGQTGFRGVQVKLLLSKTESTRIPFTVSISVKAPKLRFFKIKYKYKA